MVLRGDEPDLALGDSGDHVAELQDRLRALQLHDRFPDGTFDAATESAVRQLQSDVGHDNHGQVTQETWRALDDRLLQYGMAYDSSAGVGNQHWDQTSGGEVVAETSIAEVDSHHHWDGQQWLEWYGAEWTATLGDGANQLLADGTAAPAMSGGSPTQPAGAATCSCVDDESVGGSEAGEPPELDGVIEEGAADAADELQSRGRRHPSGSASVPTTCRVNAKACFSVSRRTAWLLRPGRVLVVAVPALGGRPGHETPTGQFSVQFHDANHVSSIYHAPMPHYVKLHNRSRFPCRI